MNSIVMLFILFFIFFIAYVALYLHINLSKEDPHIITAYFNNYVCSLICPIVPSIIYLIVQDSLFSYFGKYSVSTPIGGTLTVLLLFLYVYFLVQIAKSNTFVEPQSSISGVFIFITSTLSPVYFIVIYAVLILIPLLFKNKCEDIDASFVISRVIDLLLSLVSALIFHLWPAKKIFNISLRDIIMIGIFTMILPLFNPFLTQKIMQWNEDRSDHSDPV